MRRLYEERADAGSLAPLIAWARARCAEGLCDAASIERELRLALTAVHDRDTHGLRELSRSIAEARAPRESLLADVSVPRPAAPLVASLDARLAALPPLPREAVALRRAASPPETPRRGPRGPAAALAEAVERLRDDLDALTILGRRTQIDLEDADRALQRALAALPEQARVIHRLAQDPPQ